MSDNLSVIIVSGMEMPKNCLYCRFNYDQLCHAVGQSFREHHMEENGRLTDCPLIEVTSEADYKHNLENYEESLEKAREEIKWLRKMMMDQEKVIRCIDCNRRGTYDCPVHTGCSSDGYDEPDDWYCASGERK